MCTLVAKNKNFVEIFLISPSSYTKNYESYYRSARLQVWTILSIFNNFFYLSRSILVLIDLSWFISVYLGQSHFISVYLGLSLPISVHLGLSRTILCYIKQSWATMSYLDYLWLHLVIIGHLGLSQDTSIKYQVSGCK